MAYSVVAHRPDPPLDIVADQFPGPGRLRVLVLSGVVGVAPEQQRGIRVYVRGQQPTGDSCGLWLTDHGPIPSGYALHAEVALAQVVVTGGIDNVDVVYGIGDVAAQLAPGNDGQSLWPYVSFACYGAQPLVVRYRVTLRGPA